MGQMKWIAWEESALIEPTREEYEAALAEHERAQILGCGECRNIVERHDCGCIEGVATPKADRVIAAFERKGA